MLELGVLVRRDHDDLHYALRVLGEATSADASVVELVERVRTRFEAHTEAETLTLGTMLETSKPPPSMYFLVSQVIASHLSQETALAQMLANRIGSHGFRERARYLRQLVVHHADHEAACLHPALPDHLPREVYRTLATSYSLERDRRLAFLERAIACSA